MKLTAIQTIRSISFLLTLPFFILLVSWIAKLDFRIFNMNTIEMWLFSFISFLIAFVLFNHSINLKIARGNKVKQIESIGLLVFKMLTILFAVLLAIGFYLSSATDFHF